MNRKFLVGCGSLVVVVIAVISLGRGDGRKQATVPTGSRIVVAPDGKMTPLPDTYGSVLLVSRVGTNDQGSVSNATPDTSR
jgi:hypothetical protein